MENCQSRTASQCRPRRMARRVEHDTYAEHLTGVVEGGVASRDTGEYFIATQVAFEERTLAQLAEATMDSFERPAWCGKSDGKREYA